MKRSTGAPPRYQDQGGQFVTSYKGERGGELDEGFVGENLRMTEIAGAIAPCS